MISCSIPWDWLGGRWVSIPHEVNNEFLGNVGRASKTIEGKLPYDVFVWLADFWDVFIEPHQIDEYISYYILLKKNLDEIIKMVPLPKVIWEFDGYYREWFVMSKDVDTTVDWEKEFTKADMLLLIDLIIKKAQEAKEKGVNLQFLWD